MLSLHDLITQNNIILVATNMFRCCFPLHSHVFPHCRAHFPPHLTYDGARERKAATCICTNLHPPQFLPSLLPIGANTISLFRGCWIALFRPPSKNNILHWPRFGHLIWEKGVRAGRLRNAIPFVFGFLTPTGFEDILNSVAVTGMSNHVVKECTYRFNML